MMRNMTSKVGAQSFRIALLHLRVQQLITVSIATCDSIGPVSLAGRRERFNPSHRDSHRDEISLKLSTRPLEWYFIIIFDKTLNFSYIFHQINFIEAPEICINFNRFQWNSKELRGDNSPINSLRTSLQSQFEAQFCPWRRLTILGRFFHIWCYLLQGIVFVM